MSLTNVKRAISIRTLNFLTSGRLLTNPSLANRSRTIGKRWLQQQAVDSEFSVSLESVSFNIPTETRNIKKRESTSARLLEEYLDILRITEGVESLD